MSRKSMSRKSVSRKSVSRKSAVGRKSMARKSIAKGSKGVGAKGPKGSKDGVVKKRKEFDVPDPWVRDLEPKIICDESWRCITAQLNEFHADHVGLVDLLNQKSVRGERWPVRVISMDVIKERVLNNCEKGIEWQPFNALCEKIKETAGRNFEKPIPAELLAPLIKYIILQFKELDKDREFAVESLNHQDQDNYTTFEKMAEKTPLIEREDTLVLIGKVRKSTKGKGSKGSGSRKSMGARKSAAGRKSSAGKRKSAAGGARKSAAGGKRKSAASGARKSAAGGARKSAAGGSRKSAAGGARKSAAGGKRKSAAGGARKSAAGGARKSAAGGSRKSMSRKSVASSRKSVAGGGKGKGGKQAGGGKKKMSQLSLDVESDLNKREHPPMDVQYKEDAPLDGPNAYFVITQMRDPDLPKKLIEFGVPYTAAIVFNEEPPFKDSELPSDIKQIQDKFKHDVNTDYFERIRDHRKKPDYKGQFTKEENDLQNFWQTFIPFANNPNQAQFFKETIESLYQPRISRVDLGSPNAREQLKELLYEDVSKLMYMIHRLRKLYDKYVKNAAVLDLTDNHIPEEQETFVYHAILDALPQESYGVPMILDAILTQVEFNVDISLAFDPDQYGWILGIPPDPILKTKLEDEIMQLHKEYDLFRDEDLAKTLKAIFNPRSVVFGDSMKWRTLHLGKLGRFIRDREENILKVFIEALAFGSAPPSTDELGVHEFHRQRFGQVLGIREQKLVAETLLGAANLALIGKTHEWCGDSHGDYYFSVNGPIPADDEPYEASKHQLIGDPPCTTEECASMTRLVEHFTDPRMTKYLNELDHFSELSASVLLQRLYNAIVNSEFVEKDYSAFPDVGLFKTYNCSSKIQTRGELPTAISFRDYFKYMMSKNKRTLEDLLEIAEHDRPFIFKSKMGRLISDAELYKTATIISEDLTVDDTHFVEPYSYIEEHTREKPHEMTTEAVPQPKPYEEGKSRFYSLPQIQAKFSETKKSFTFENGTRVNLKYDDTVLSRHKIAIKVSYDNHNLIYRTPLYPNFEKGKVFLELENGIIFSFTEGYRSPALRANEPEKNVENKPVAEAPKEPETVQLPEKPPPGWLPSKAQSMEWDCSKFPDTLMGKWVGLMVPVGYKPKEEEEEEEIEVEEEKEPSSSDNIKENRIDTIMRAKKREVCEKLVDQLGLCSKFGIITRPHKMLGFSPFDRKSLDSTMDYDTPLPSSEFELQLSWPTGLHVQFLKSGYGQQAVAYIKQRYLIDRKDYFLISDEIYRCVASDGTVIRFLKKGHEILYPNGAKVFFEKFENPTVDEEDKEEEEGEEVVEPRENQRKLVTPKSSEKRKSRSKSRENVVKIGERDKQPGVRRSTSKTTIRSSVSTNILVEEEIHPETYVTSSDGTQRHVIPGQLNELIKSEKMIDFDDFFCNVRMTVRSDGTKFIFRDDGERIVRFSDGTEIRTEVWMNKEEFFVPWSLPELFMWFEYDPKWFVEEKKEVPEEDGLTYQSSPKTRPSSSKSQNARRSFRRSKSVSSNTDSTMTTDEIEPPKSSIYDEYEYMLHEEEGEGKKRIKLAEDGFVVIGISYTVYHPHFSAIRCGCRSQEVFTLFMPGETTLSTSTRKGEFTVKVGNTLDKVEMKLQQKKCIFDHYSNGKLFQRAHINLQCFRTLGVPKPPINLFSLVDSNSSELTIDTDGNSYTRVARVNDPCENLQSRTSDFRSFVVRRDFSGIELFPSNRIEKLKKLAFSKGKNKVKFSKRAVLNRALIMQPTNSLSGYWAMNYSPHYRKCVFKLPSTYGKDWTFPFRKKKSKKDKIPQFVVVDVINNVESKFETSSIVKSMLEAYELSLLEGQIEGCQCGTTRTKSTTNLYPRELDYMVRNVKKGQTPCKCQLLSALGKIAGREDATLCRYFYNKKEPSSMTQGKCEAVDSWINDDLVPHVVKMATKKHQLNHMFGNMRSYLKAFCSVKVPNYFECAKGAVFSIIDEVLNRVHHVAKEIYRWETLDEILDVPANEVTDDQIWDLVLCMNPAEEGLGNLTQEQFLKLLQSARALYEFLPTMRSALDYRRNIIEGEMKDENSEQSGSEELENEGRETQSRSIPFVTRSKSSVSNVFLKQAPSWCQSKEHSIAGCSCTSLIKSDEDIKTYHTHLGPPLTRKEFFRQDSQIGYSEPSLKKTKLGGPTASEEFDEEMAAEEEKEEGEEIAWEWRKDGGNKDDVNSKSPDSIQKMIELILTAPPRWGGEDAWMNEIEKCEMAVLRAAKEDRKESWIRKMEDFKKPLFKRKEVDHIMRDMLKKMGDHINKLNIYYKCILSPRPLISKW